MTVRSIVVAALLLGVGCEPGRALGPRDDAAVVDSSVPRNSGPLTVLDPDGIVIAAGSGSKGQPSVAFGGGIYLVVWNDVRSMSTYYDVYGARVSRAGEVLDPGGGFEVLTGAGGEYKGSLAFGTSSFLVGLTRGQVGSSLEDVRGARVSAAGKLLDQGGILVAKGKKKLSAPVVGSGDAGFLMAWAEERGALEYDVYSTRLSALGKLLDPSPTLIKSGRGVLAPTAVAFDGTNFLVAWEHWFDKGLMDVFCTRVTAGNKVLDPDGVNVSAAPRMEQAAAVAFDGINYLVVWEDLRNNDYDIYAARVSKSGKVLESTGIAVAVAPDDQVNPAVAFNGTGYLVVWQHYGPAGPEVHGSRMDVDGRVLDPGGVTIATGSGLYFPSVASDGADYLVVWEDMRRGIIGARVRP